MRRDAIYPATIVGRPPMEDAYLIEASERLFLVPAQLILPEIVDYHMPPAGIAHNLVNVVIEKSYPGQAYKVANGLLGLGQMMFAKVVLVTDADVRPQDHAAFWHTVLANAVPGRDHQIAKGPIDVLDHASRAWSYGSKLVIDGTVKHPEELGGATATWKPNPERDRAHLPPHAEVLDQHQPGGGFWFLTTQKNRAGQGRHVGRVGGASGGGPRGAPDRRPRPRDRPARPRGRDLDDAQQHRPGARRAGDRRRLRPGVGDRRDAEAGRGGFRPHLARQDHHARGGERTDGAAGRAARVLGRAASPVRAPASPGGGHSSLDPVAAGPLGAVEGGVGPLDQRHRDTSPAW
jgi:3-polyprenyl-4-hydroxybenzoate decarboxylase